MRISTIILLCFSTLFTVQCQRAEEPVNTNLEKIKHQNDTLRIIQSIIRDMEPFNTLGGDNMGTCFPRSSNVYPLFERLSNYANNDVLVKLTKNRKPNIRAYAFWFLAKRHYKNLETIYAYLKNDEEPIILCFGIEQHVEPVGLFCKYVVTNKKFDPGSAKFDDATLARLHAK